MKSIVQDAIGRKISLEHPISSLDSVQEKEEYSPMDAELREILEKLRMKIKIVGCGGGGCNTVSRISDEGIRGAELIATNTDAQHLLAVHAPKKVLLGRMETKGLGAGAIPEIGEKATRETEDEIRKALSGSHLVIITCGLGGGTGTGGAPVIARIAKEVGALSIAFVTLPFKGEGVLRTENAMKGLNRLKEYADTVIVIPNDKLLELVPRIPLSDAFKVADEVLMKAIRGLTEMMYAPGIVNLDFNDLKTVMKNGGVAMIGFGEGSDSSSRAMDAFTEAVNSPLLEVDISGSLGILINVSGGEDMTISEAQEVVEAVAKVAHKDATIIWGARVDPELEGVIKVMLVATGVKSSQIVGRKIEENARRFGLELVR